MTKHYPSKKEKLTDQFLSDYNSIKGHFAESFLKQLFYRLRLRTIDTGVEHTHPELSSLRAANLIAFDALKDVRKSPDMHVIVPDRKKESGYRFVPVAVEVKYREGRKIKVSELNEYAHVSNPNFIFVFLDREGIYALHRDEISSSKKTFGRGKYQEDYVFFEDCQKFHEIKMFNFSNDQKAMIEMFELISKDFFGSLSVNKSLGRKIMDWLNDSPLLKKGRDFRI